MGFDWKLAGLLVLLLIAMTFSPVIVDLTLVLLALWALTSPKHAIQAAWLSMLIKFLNPALVSYTFASGLLMWLVLLFAGARILPGLRTGDLRLLVPVWLFAAVAAALAVPASPALAISLMKVLIFTWVVSTVIVAFRRLDAVQLHDLGEWARTLAIIVAVLSALTLAQPSIAYLRTGTGLQGIFNHPQALGVFLAPFAAWFTAELILKRRGFTVLQLAAAGLTWAVIVLTEARTAAIAATLGIAAAFALQLWAGRRHADQPSSARIVAVICVGLLAAVLTGVVTEQLSRSVASFALKRGGTSLEVSFYESRGRGIESQWRNFLARPWTGWGFGVYPDGKFPEGVTRFAGIPISAPIEKGFVPTAVLEETGIPGALCFLAVLVALTRRAARAMNRAVFASFVTALAVNFGEAVIFSPGGVGLHVWMMIGLATATGTMAMQLPAASRKMASSTGTRVRFPNILRRNDGADTAPSDINARIELRR